MFGKPIFCAGLTLLFLSATAAAAEIDARLIEAARKADHAAIQTLLRQKVDVNSSNVDGATALHWAVRIDHAGTVQLLLRAGANPKSTDRYGVTPLQLAAVNGNAVIIRSLLDAGASADSKEPTGETILMTAARTGRPDALKVLIEGGAPVNAKDPEFEQTALMLAVRENHPAAVKLLIDSGADVNTRTRVGETPAFRPPCKGTGCGSEGVGINRGGLPDRGRRASAAGGMTPLLYAARDGRLEAAKLLVAAGANVRQPEANDVSPLLMAILNNNLDVAAFLLDRGADINASDFWGRSPLWSVVELRNRDMNNREQDSPTDNGMDRAPMLEFIKLLIARGANVNARTKEVPPGRTWLYSLGDVSWVDYTGQTPFLRAALSGDTTVMRLLLASGADPNISTFAGTTALMAAAGVNWVVAQTYTESKEALLEAVGIALEKGADINATNSMGLTALLGAANRGSNEIIEFLEKNGARLDVVDKHNRGPITWAEGVFLAAVGAERKPSTIALLEKLMAEKAPR